MLVTISGPSTVGKDSSWLRLAESLGFIREVPFTTRRQRPREHEGVDHRYVSVDQFQQLIREGRLFEWDYVLGHYYGTDSALESRVRTGENLVLQVLARMALRIKRRISSACTVMLVTSERETLEARLKARGYTGPDLIARINHGLEEIAHAPLFDFVVPDADIMTDADVIRSLRDIVSSDLLRST